ncbi:hypothetical protein HYQ45_013434 [Verticillium longisporum]|uniref:Uncharacterized protein n=1 Tax=Verticillium longisporum TaxID=100787 RepID=A0A8I3AJD9_VERLO|nr:hypothetical protein HYQ45_013434 [Verticillium longisporum]
MAYQYPPPQVSSHAAQANMPPAAAEQHARRVSARSCCGQAEEQAGLPSNLGGLWSLSTTEDPLYPIHI